MARFFNSKKPDSLLLILLLVWWVVNIIQATFSELANDEAYYWIFARDLDWGYFDHPPMTALLVWMGNFIGGEAGVRFFFTILQPLYLYIMWLVIRPRDPRASDATLYFIICAAIPVLQLYGFIAVPDGPLMMFTALFLLFFKRFSENDSWLNTVILGAVMAGLAYSKYQAALVVLFAFLANPRLLKNPRTYAAGAVTLLLFIPHLLWQYHHDWVSFRYHLIGRNGIFKWNYVTEYLLNLLLIFNPLYVPLYIAGWRKSPGSTPVPVRRAMHTIVAGFVIFFALSSVRGYVQPQWVIPITFGLIMILFNYARSRPRVERYVKISGLVSIFLVVLVRIVMIFNPIGIKFEVFDNKESYSSIQKAVEDRPLIFAGSYAIASKYIFYTGGVAYSQPSIYYRTSQWELIDTDTRLAGSQVAVQTSREKGDSTINLANGRTFSWKVIDDFRPVRNVSAEIAGGEIPDLVTPGQVLNLRLRISNPYPYSISIDPDGIYFAMAWKPRKERFREFVTDAKMELPAGGEAFYDLSFTVPHDLPSSSYRVGFILRYDVLGSWFAGREYSTQIKR